LRGKDASQPPPVPAPATAPVLTGRSLEKQLMSSEVKDQAESDGLSEAAAAEVLAATLAGAQAALACWERRADGDLHLVAANDRYLRFMGKPGQNLIGGRLQDTHTNLQEEVLAIILHVVSSGEPFHLERLAQHD